MMLNHKIEESSKLVAPIPYKQDMLKTPLLAAPSLFKELQNKALGFLSDKPTTFTATLIAAKKPLRNVTQPLIITAVDTDAQRHCDLGKLYYNGDSDKRDYEAARGCFETAASLGSAEAQCYLGVLYHFGHGVQADYVKAVQWYEKAALQENADAQFYLGELFYMGRGINKDQKKAFEWFEKAAAQGHDRAKEASKMFQKIASLVRSANMGDVQAQYDLGKLYYNGDGVDRDYVAAHGWFELAADQGNADAQYHLGVQYHLGQGIKIDYVKAFEWYEKAALQGNIEAQFCLGELLYMAKGVEKSFKKAHEWLEKAAAQGHARALDILRELEKDKISNLRKEAESDDIVSQYKLGMIYIQGKIVDKDDAKGRFWLKKAADRGIIKAQTALKELDEQWMKPLIATAQAGDISEQFKLGLIYLQKKDMALAYHWIGKAATQGHTEAQYTHGVMDLSFNASGSDKRYTIARIWFEQAAAKGHILAKYNLGIMYFHGLGVQCNYVIARQLFEQISDQLLDAQYFLAVIYFNGLGIESDKSKAQSICDQAAKKGHVQSKAAMEKFDKESENPLSISYLSSLSAKAQKEPGVLAESNKKEDRQVPSKQDSDQSQPPLSMASPNSLPQKKEITEQDVLRFHASQEHTFVENCLGLEKSISESYEKLSALYKQSSSGMGLDLSGVKGKEDVLQGMIVSEERRLQGLKERQKILNNEKAADFYFVFQQTFNQVISACMVLNTKMFGVAKETLKTKKVDTGLNVTTMLEEWSQSVPGAGFLLKLLNTPLKQWNNLEKGDAVSNVAHLFSGALSYEPIGEMIAWQVTNALIQEIEKIPMTKPGFFKRQLEKIHQLKSKLFTADNVDFRLRSFAEEQCAILLIAFMKGEIKKRPEPKDVPILVAKILKKEPAAIPVELSLGLGGGPVNQFFDPTPTSFDPTLAVQLSELQKAHKKDQEVIQRLKQEHEQERQTRIAWGDKYQKYEKVFEVFMRVTFPDESVSAGSRGDMDQLQLNPNAHSGPGGVNMQMMNEIAKLSARQNKTDRELAVVKEHVGIDLTLERKEDANEARRLLFS